jgi:hypothetical protein
MSTDAWTLELGRDGLLPRTREPQANDPRLRVDSAIDPDRRTTPFVYGLY